MATRVNIDLKMIGDKALTAAFATFPDKMQKSIARKAFKKAALLVKRAQERLIPVDTGRLKGLGLTVKPKKNSGRGNRAIGSVILTPTRQELGIAANAKFYYPAHVELGHGNVAPRPFMRKGMAMKRRSAITVASAELRKGMERVWRKAGGKLGG